MNIGTREVLSLTPREFAIELAAAKERQYDEYQRMADSAWMMRQAYHAKKLKPSELFKRPTDEDKAQKRTEELRDKAEQATEWLAQFKQFN